MKDKLILYAVCLCDLSVPFLEEKRSLFPSEQRKCSHQAVLKETKPLSLSYSKHMTHLSGWRKRRTGRYAASLNVLAQLNKEWLFKMSKNPERKIKTQPIYQSEPNADLTLLNMYRTSGGSPAESYTAAQSRKIFCQILNTSLISASKSAGGGPRATAFTGGGSCSRKRLGRN